MVGKNNYDKHTDLMLRFQKGDEGAYRSLLGRYKKNIYAFCHRYLQNQLAAEAACQEIFLRVYAARNSFQPEEAFAVWLFSIASHVLQNDVQPEWEGREPARRVYKNNSAQAFESQILIRRVIAELDKEERIALLLDHWERFSIPEISDILNRNPMAVETILFKARAKLRIKLAAYIEPARVG